MRSGIIGRSLVAIYILGAVWSVVLFVAVALLLQPMSALYAELGIAQPLVAMACTLGLALLAATVITGRLALGVRRRRVARAAAAVRVSARGLTAPQGSPTR